MIDARILVEIGLKRHFGSILSVMGSNTSTKGSSTSSPRLEHKYAQVHFPRARAYACIQYMAAIIFLGKSCPSPTRSSTLPSGSSARVHTVHGSNHFPWKELSLSYLD